jgi:hypothetical protein
MRRGLLSIALGLILGTIALFPMFVSAAGHDSTSIFVRLAHSVAINWPFSLADFLLPASASRSVSSLGLAIHYSFYTLIAWLLLSILCRRVSRAAA